MALVKAIFEPRRIFSFLKWNTYGRLTSLVSRFSTEHQFNRIHNDLLEDDEFLIIVLDACRYDFFKSNYDLFLEGELEKVYSSGRLTFEYVANTWDGDHKDMLYVSGINAISSHIDEEVAKQLNTDYPGDYLPKDHLRILNVNSTGWDEELSTVPPEKITEEVLDEIEHEDKIVAHYLQPHTPYVGDYKLQDLLGEDEFRGLDHVQTLDLYRQGLISQKELKRAYRSNLVYALQEVKKLVEEVDDRRVVITSDHGEMLGESGLLAHPKKHHHLLREVPWLEVKGTKD